MKGLLLRVGIDKTYGRYNAPINPLTNDYLYMPIPEGQESPQQIFRQGMQTTYAQMDTHFSKFTGRNAIQLAFPEHLRAINCHLDPDFENLTYGDQGSGRGNRVRKLYAGDFIAFFASFRPIPNIPCDHVLVYALYGVFFIDDIKKAKDVSSDQWHVNAHTRIQKMNGEHLIAFADKSRSVGFVVLSQSASIGMEHIAYQIKFLMHGVILESRTVSFKGVFAHLGSQNRSSS